MSTDRNPNTKFKITANITVWYEGPGALPGDVIIESLVAVMTPDADTAHRAHRALYTAWENAVDSLDLLS